MKHQDLIRLAHDIRGDLGSPPFDAQVIAKARGLNVRFATLDDQHAHKIASFYRESDHTIVVNRVQSPEQMNMAIAHQIGYRDILPQLRIPTMIGINAHPTSISMAAFAAHLIAPVSAVQRHARIASVSELSLAFCVPADVIETQMELSAQHPKLLDLDAELRVIPARGAEMAFLCV